MRKFSTMLIALLAAVTMSAETIKVDTLTSAKFGFDKLDNGYTELSFTSTAAGVAYKAVANGGNKLLQIRTSKSTEGIVSTTSGGYIKSIQIVQNAQQGAKQIDVYGCNTALAAPSDLYGDTKATKLTSATTLDVTYSFTENYQYFGIRSNSGARYMEKVIITWTDTKPGKDPGTWTPDTISITEARALIDKGDVHTHYVKGVVCGTPFESYSGSKVYGVWLTDINNPSDSLEAFSIRKGKETTNTYANVDSVAKDFGLQDTVMFFAEGLSLYTAKQAYQATPSYFVESLGKAQSIDASKTFPYPFGAVYKDTIDGKYRYEIVLSKTEDAYDNALHYVIRSSNAKGIAGKHSIYSDYSYVDEEGEVTSGNLTISFVSAGNPLNTYAISGSFSVGGVTYNFDKAQYQLAGYLNPDSEPYQLVDDAPFIPNEGDTITCAQALSYASYVGTDTAKSVNVYIHGFAVSKPALSKYTALAYSFYLHDDKTASKGTVQSYYCVLQNSDTICKGDEAYLYGKVSLYNSTPQIANGKCYRVLSTGLKEVAEAAKKVKVQKMVMGNQFYIVKDGVIYNAQGQVIK